MHDDIVWQGTGKDRHEPAGGSRDPAHRDVPEIYEFGPFRLEPAERKLWRASEIVALTPKAFDTLHVLVRNSGHLIDKEDLIRMLWPDTFVEEGSLSNNIFLLRKALGEDVAYIETIPKRGYRFVGAVRQLPKPVSGSREKGLPELELANKITAEKQLLGGAVPGLSREGWARRTPVIIAVTVFALLVAAVGHWLRRPGRGPDRSRWVQLTNFPDSVTQPALSADGRMLAFVRGYSTWIGPGQIYVKMLPDGEPVPLTHDTTLKTDPTFSPDDSQIAYTTLNLKEFSWDTVVSPTLGGGDPQPLLRNASGLTWIGPKNVMFSEIKAGVHMGIVAADEGRLKAQDIYVPADEPGMAHRSYLSPDRKWVLLVEMDKDHYFLPCRLVPTEGSSHGRHVGPLGGSCLSAAWSPDGKWMYFTANSGGVSHIWRQQFPDGRPEQITSGPTEEDGIAMAPDGHSFVTSVALQSTSLWVHDAKGERQVSLEGNGRNPKFTPDGKKLCYVVAKEATSDFAWYRNPGELHIADLQSGRSETFQPGFLIQDYDISADGRWVVMWTTGHDGKSQFWLAPLDRSSSPVQIPDVEGASPMFGPDGDIFFRRVEKTSTFVYRVRPDGTGLRKAVPDPIFVLTSVSPTGNWIVGWAPLPNNGPPTVQAFPLDGGPAVVIGPTHTYLSWSLDGRSVLVSGSYLVPLAAGDALPRIPKGGFQSEEEISQMRGARRIEGGGVVLGPSADVYAFYRGTIQRNLYRIPIR